MLEANLPQFKKMTKLIEMEDYYEVEKARPTIRLDLPVQIGYFILQYGKLHMLQFYYNFWIHMWTVQISSIARWTQNRLTWLCQVQIFCQLSNLR